MNSISKILLSSITVLGFLSCSVTVLKASLSFQNEDSRSAAGAHRTGTSVSTSMMVDEDFLDLLLELPSPSIDSSAKPFIKKELVSSISGEGQQSSALLKNMLNNDMYLQEAVGVLLRCATLLGEKKRELEGIDDKVLRSYASAVAANGIVYSAAERIVERMIGTGGSTLAINQRRANAMRDLASQIESGSPGRASVLRKFAQKEERKAEIDSTK